MTNEVKLIKFGFIKRYIANSSSSLAALTINHPASYLLNRRYTYLMKSGKLRCCHLGSMADQPWPGGKVGHSVFAYSLEDSVVHPPELITSHHF